MLRSRSFGQTRIDTRAWSKTSIFRLKGDRRMVLKRRRKRTTKRIVPSPRKRGEGSVEIKQQYFRALTGNRHRLLILDRRTIAGDELLSIQLDLAACHLHPAVS